MRASLCLAAALVVAFSPWVAVRSAERLDTAPISRGLVLYGSIVPTLTLLPVMDGAGVASAFPPGPDIVTGYDRNGRLLFRRTFRDKIYNYYVFIEADNTTIRALHRLRLRIGGHVLERTAVSGGPPTARVRTIGAQRVRVTWNARAFPRLACHDGGGGSPAPLMLDGDFIAADIRGKTLYCDFSDGVKTRFAGVALRIEP